MPKTNPMQRRGSGWVLVSGLFVALAAVWGVRAPLPAPGAVSLSLSLPAAAPGVSEPLLVSGRTGMADFLFVRYVAPARVVFGYDSWGFSGPLSEPVDIVPGKPVDFHVEMPSLMGADPGGGARHLRLSYGGRTVFDLPVHSYPHANVVLEIARNSAGGSSCGPRLSGRLVDARGREVRGDYRRTVPIQKRVRLALAHSPLAFPILLGMAFALASLVRFAAGAVRSLAASPATFRSHRAFLATALACTAFFTGMMTGWRWDLTFNDLFGYVYDYQADAFIRGRLDLPLYAIGNEAFVVDGKNYGYFGPVPALLRLPFVMFDVGFGRLSRLFYIAYYVACLGGVYALLRQLWRMSRGTGAEEGAPPAWLVVLLTLNVGIGSTLLFLSSRVYVYHEAILAGCAFALWSCRASLRHLEEAGAGATGEASPAAGGSPAGVRTRWWLSAWWLGLLSLHTRPTTGLFALGLLGMVALIRLWRAVITPRGTPGAAREAVAPSTARLGSLAGPVSLGFLALIGILSFNGLSYVKFGSFEGAPLRFHRQYDAARLARIEGKNFHLSNIPRNLDAYVLKSTHLWRPTFPYFYCGGTPRALYPEARIDLDEPMLGLPYAMPALSVLSLIGLVGGAWLLPRLRTTLFALAAASLPVILSMLAAVATSHRYTGDFVPLMAAFSCAGCIALAPLAGELRTLAATVLLALTLMAFLAGTALTLSYQGEGVWGSPDQIVRDFAEMRKRIDAIVLPPRDSRLP